MSDDAITPPPDGGDPGRLAGERLADARAERELGLHEIAKELHLDEYKVQALEQNNFEVLGAPVFVKGYLRKYAALVGMPIDDILADYFRMNSSASVPLVIPHRAPPPRGISPGPWLGGITVVAVAAAAGWWWISSGPQWADDEADSAALAPFAEGSVAQPPTESQPETNQAQANPQPAAEDVEMGTPEPVTDEPSRQNLAQVQPAGESDLPDEGEVELRVTFNGDCWTEVTDAAGERLYFGLGSAGRSVTVSGEPPLQVLLGNSANASLEVNGSIYAIPRSARRGDTARLTIADL
jgi:cytoskeleton protein RodZ